MSLADLLITLRKRLINSIEKKDDETLQLLCITFGILREAAYTSENKQLISALADLEYSAQHGAMGFWNQAKDIPTVETIIASLATNEK